jgi:hypothetical protein
MKKLYFLFTLLGSLLSFSQGSINFDDATKWTQGAAAFTSYSNHTYVDGTFSLACLDVIRNGTAAQDLFPGAIGTYSLRLQNDATTEVVFTIASGGVGNFTFKARRWDADPVTNFTVEYSTDGGTNWTTSSTINASVTTDSDWKNINGIVNSSNVNVKIRIKSNGTTERIMVDDFTWTAPTTNPTIAISSPANNAVFSPVTTSVNVTLSVSNFNVANGTGNGHIRYNVNSGTNVLKYDTTPIALTSLTPGAYTVFVELVDNSNQPLSPAVNATVNFSIASYNTVSNLAALRADVITNGAGKYYQISSNPIITYARSSTYRNQKYIQDATAGILIDDVPGTISTPMVAGDAISSLRGQASLFNGVLQLLPIENATIASSGNTVTPQIVTAANIIANIEAYESELVQINNVTFTTADGTIIFAGSTNYNMNDGSDIAFRSLFAEANYIGQVIPQGAANRVFLVAEFNGTAQVVARSLADVTLSSSSFNAIDGLTMYPNPLKGNTLYFTSTANADMSVQIYDVLGKEVVNSKVMNNTVNVSGLNAGVYMVKVTEEGKTATRKLVIQ